MTPPAAVSELPDFANLLGESRRRLAEIEPKLPCRFKFRWHGLAFGGEVEQAPGGAFTLRLGGDLGAVPYTSENRELRDALLDFLKRLSDTGSVRIGLDDRNVIRLLGSTGIEVPLTGQAVFTAATRFLLDSKPYLLIATEIARRDKRARIAGGTLN